MTYEASYAQRNLGPYYEGALKISEAIRDGARLPQFDDIDAIKAIIDEHITMADNREAEKYANKIIMEWKEANGKTTVFGPFTSGITQSGRGSLGSLFGFSDEEEESKGLSGFFDNDTLNNMASLRSLQDKQNSASSDEEREKITTQLKEKSEEFARSISEPIKDKVNASESFHLCAKIIAMGPDSPLKTYYKTIMDETVENK